MSETVRMFERITECLQEHNKFIKSQNEFNRDVVKILQRLSDSSEQTITEEE